MAIFTLPYQTEVNKVIPKNAFDSYINTAQKRQFIDFVSKIFWVNKLSPDSINLPAGEIKEIQIFEITLKSEANIKPILEIIDKSIPYHIIFIIYLGSSFYISASAKHPNPLNENNTVIDWTFKTDWMPISENNLKLDLKKNLDYVFTDLCHKITGITSVSNTTLDSLVKSTKKKVKLKKEIERLKIAISKSKQFNQKVELNLRLKEVESLLNNYKNKS
jgi:hypothetical protein